MDRSRSVCVTGASGFIGSWLVMKLLQRGYHVKATVRDPGNMRKVKHLLDLPNASTHLSLWKGDLIEEGSFDDAILGCIGVFHVATPMEFLNIQDPENEVIKPTVNGVLNIMRSCSKAKTVKRLIFTSTTGTIAVQRQPAARMYFVAKTTAEKAAWEFAKENGIDLVTIQPSLVLGPFLTPSRPGSIEISLALITRNEALYPTLIRSCAVHLDDLCNAHIYLFEHSQAKGRYICSSHCFTIFSLSKSLSQKYPEFEGVDESLKAIPCSSKKLLDLGFKFKYSPDEYNVSDLFGEAIESCKEKGLMPLHSRSQASSED
ncbi:hypothetical protein F0562_027204 [Nyssa sinensis]|uniref:Dihydroflavonol 4-reductase n=1 Tax=Nyssa sinensis TaxID=561372 RepID=A0A5J5B5Q3_9ASTE|nr:hypothetical protein F0562_027204 [Nyssa sinensis]